MAPNASGPAAEDGAGIHSLASDGPGHSETGCDMQPKPRFCREIRLTDAPGGKARVEVVPYPAKLVGGNRICGSPQAARMFARQLQQERGWPIIDKLTGKPGFCDPVRRIGVSKVYVWPEAGKWAVKLWPRPYGVPERSGLFSSDTAALRYAEKLADEHRPSKGPWVGGRLQIIVGGER